MPRNSAALRETLIRSVGDKLWRLKNLYRIKDAETGRVIPFRPRPEQLAIYEALLRGAKRIIILKARRLGMSTAIDVYAADEAAFNAGVQISIVDQNQADAAEKAFRNCEGRARRPAEGHSRRPAHPAGQRRIH